MMNLPRQGSGTRGKVTWTDIVNYLVGNVRHWLWYKCNKAGIRWWIKEQIECRLVWMNAECYSEGSCVRCGCRTVEMQMCNKGCEGCYPEMMNRKAWEKFKRNLVHVDKYGTWCMYNKIDVPEYIPRLHLVKVGRR